MPGIPLKLVARDGRLLPGTVGLVDSGCDVSMFPAAWAKTLGIDLTTDCESGTGNTAAGQAPQFRYEPGIDAVVMGKKIHLETVFSEGLPIILLGREDFFAYYKITFDQQTKTFRVEPYDD